MKRATVVLKPTRSRVAQIVWKIVPVSTTQMLLLPMPIETASEWLFTHINRTWTIDGGIRYFGRARTPYQDIQNYTGVVIDHTFTLGGPFGFGTIPMIVEGELQAQGQTSIVHLSVHTMLYNTVSSMGGSLLRILLVVGLGVALLGWWGGVPIPSLTVQVVLLLLVVYFFITYVTVVRCVHRQVDLLLKHLASSTTNRSLPS